MSWVAALAGEPRRPNQSIPLLPSGPGGVFNLSSRGPTRATIVGAKPCISGGERGIRTLETGFSRLHTFQACSFDRSDTSPQM